MRQFSAVEWRLRTRTLDTADHSLIMGVVNVTPDSFSDGGAFIAGDRVDHDGAVAHGLELVADGADIIDVGGESTRPGAEPVSVAEESARVLPVVAALAERDVVVSIDTSKPAVAREALRAGAEIVNDVSGLEDPAMVRVCVEHQPGVVIMHMQGTPRSMQADPTYEDVVVEVVDHLARRVDEARDAGLEPDRVCVDPGIGFGKTVGHNLELLGSLASIVALGHPVLVGVSRKSFIGAVLSASGLDTAPPERDAASAAVAALAVGTGVAVIRAHDVRLTLESTRLADAMVRGALQT